jgi:hypothetical protein
MTKLGVFPDTGVLLAMIVFPRDQHGQPTFPDDVPIFAAAAVAQPDIVVSNDFQAFHTPRAKEFWAQSQIQIESLYSLLCVFGRRERKD